MPNGANGTKASGPFLIALHCFHSSLSFTLASLTVCHCIFLGSSTPPAHKGDYVIDDVARAGAFGGTCGGTWVSQLEFFDCNAAAGLLGVGDRGL